MRNIKRLNAEIKALCLYYGEENVSWAPNYDWVRVTGFPLPSCINKERNNVLIIIPEGYGYGEPLKDLFVDPDLKIWRNGRLKEIPHYFPKMGELAQRFQEQYGKNWRYMCLHQKGWDPKRDSILSYLNQVYTYLSDPFRWEAE